MIIELHEHDFFTWIQEWLKSNQCEFVDSEWDWAESAGHTGEFRGLQFKQSNGVIISLNIWEMRELPKHSPLKHSFHDYLVKKAGIGANSKLGRIFAKPVYKKGWLGQPKKDYHKVFIDI